MAEVFMKIPRAIQEHYQILGFVWISPANDLYHGLPDTSRTSARVGDALTEPQ